MKHFRVKPLVCEELEWAQGTTQSMYGVIATGWRKLENGGFTLTVTVPGNTTAKVSIPKPEKIPSTWMIREGSEVVWENGAYLSRVPGIESASENETFVTFTLGSGKFQFHAE